MDLEGRPWKEYYAIRGERPEPRPLLSKTLAAREAAGLTSAGRAVELGCGEGSDTAELLRRGWTVHAIDASAEGIERTRAQAEVADAADRLTTECARFEELGELPPADLYYAALSLPFAGPEAFPGLWAKVRRSAEENRAWLSLHLFGVEDDWKVKENQPLAFHDRAGVEELVDGLEVHLLEELRWDGPTITGRQKRWHGFEIVASSR